MTAVFISVRAALRRRKLPTCVIAFVILLASGAATLALSLTVETDAPFDRAFAAAHGAHLTIVYNAASVSTSALRRTATAHGVTATAGPWPEMVATYTHTSPDGSTALQGLAIVGRAHPNSSVDRLTIETGRWVRSATEVVASRALADSWGLRLGDTLSPDSGESGPTLHVVGIAASISPYTDAWVVPAEVSALVSRDGAHLQQMLYRVAPAATDAQLSAASRTITAQIGPGAVRSVGNYLDVKRNADIIAAVMVPFLLAFSIFAIVASILIISNVVSGTVVSSYREIGVMRAVGFTPSGVVAVLLLQILLPAAVGCICGVAIGTLGSQPFLSNTAHALGLPAPFTAALPVDAAVLLGVILLVSLAALLPAFRAGRMSAISAITLGSAPAASHASGFSRFALSLPLPRGLALGLAETATRPLRSLMTLGAILSGVATVVFALDLYIALGLVAEHVDRDLYAQVDIYPVSAGQLGTKGGGPAPSGFPTPPSIGTTTTMLHSDRATARFVREGLADINVPGISEPIPYIAYHGPSGWLGYAMIAGRWFSRPGEVVAPTKLLTDAHLHLGQSITVRAFGRPMHLKIVGEVFDQSYGNHFLRGTWSSLAAADPGLAANQIEVQVRPGADVTAYVERLRRANIDVQFANRASSESSFILFDGVIAALALVLSAIAVAGVFNTVLLNVREGVRDIAILRAIGMGPRGVLAMVMASVALLGIVAGVLGIPLGAELHRYILTFMGKIASGTNLPASFLDPLNHLWFPVLVLSGVAIALIGAWLPARWATRSRVSDVLSRE